jgi:hypothetical protein
MIEKTRDEITPLRRRACMPEPVIQCERGEKSYWLFVIRYWGREEEVSGQRQVEIRKDEEVAFLRGRDVLVPL